MSDKESLLSQYALDYENIHEESIRRLIRNFKARIRYRKKKREGRRVRKGNSSKV